MSFIKRVLVAFSLVAGFLLLMIAIGIVAYLVVGTKRVGGLGIVAIAYSLLLAKRLSVKMSLGKVSSALLAFALGLSPLLFVEPEAPDLVTALGIALGALGEEALFRGLVQGYLGDDLKAILVTSLLFSLSHSLGHRDPIYLSNIFLGGLALGIMKVLGKGIVAPFAFHLAWNLSSYKDLYRFESSLEGLSSISLSLVLTLVMFKLSPKET